MKRAARHFGERLGNALYVKGNGIKTAPRTNKDALLELERSDALNLFGDQAALRASCLEQQGILENDNFNTLQASAGQVDNHYPIQQPTPVASTAVPHQQTHKPVPMMPSNQYAPASRPSYVAPTAIHSNFNQATTSTNPAAQPHNGQNNNFSTSQQNPGVMAPPRAVETRGVSPETSVPNAALQANPPNIGQKRTVANMSGNHSYNKDGIDADQDTIKKQTRNPYSNNRQSIP
jgi:hypothetical protein